MATTKKDKFNHEDIKTAELAKALGHPARIAILRILAERKMRNCGEIVEELPLAQATVSQHLKALKAAGLITAACDGPCTRYELNARAIEKFSTLLNSFVKNLKDCC